MMMVMMDGFDSPIKRYLVPSNDFGANLHRVETAMNIFSFLRASTSIAGSLLYRLAGWVINPRVSISIF